MRPAFPCMLVVVLLAPAFSRAQDPVPPMAPPALVSVVAGLEYSLGPGAELCPGERMLHEEVSRRLGYDPFEPAAKGRPMGTFRTSIAGTPKGLAATTEHTDAAGVLLWTKPYDVNGRSRRACEVAISGVAIQIVTELTVFEEAPPAPPPPVCPPPPPCPRCEPAPAREPVSKGPPEEPPPEPKVPVVFLFGVGIWADLISNDRGSLGLTFDVGLRYRFFSVAIEGRGDPALGATLIAQPSATSGSLSFARGTGALLLCGHIGWVAGCFESIAGRVMFPGSVPAVSAKSYAAAGVRLGLEVPVVPWFLVRLSGELLPTINPASAVVNKESVFQVAGWNAGLGVGALFALGRL